MFSPLHNRKTHIYPKNFTRYYKDNMKLHIHDNRKQKNPTKQSGTILQSLNSVCKIFCIVLFALFDVDDEKYTVRQPVGRGSIAILELFRCNGVCSISCFRLLKLSQMQRSFWKSMGVLNTSQSKMRKMKQNKKLA